MEAYENVTLVSFLITCVISLALFGRWLVKKLITIVESVVISQTGLKSSIDQNTMVIQQLQQSMENTARDVRDIRT